MSMSDSINAARQLCDTFFVRYVMTEACYTDRGGETYFACNNQVEDLGLQCLGKGHQSRDNDNATRANVTIIGVLLTSKRALQQFVAEAPLCDSCYDKLAVASKAKELDDTEMYVEVAIPEPFNVAELVNIAAAALAMMEGQ